MSCLAASKRKWNTDLSFCARNFGRPVVVFYFSLGTHASEEFIVITSIDRSRHFRRHRIKTEIADDGRSYFSVSIRGVGLMSLCTPVVAFYWLSIIEKIGVIITAKLDGDLSTVTVRYCKAARDRRMPIQRPDIVWRAHEFARSRRCALRSETDRFTESRFISRRIRDAEESAVEFA